MIACVSPGAGDALAVFLWGGLVMAAGLALVTEHRDTRTDRPGPETANVQVNRNGAGNAPRAVSTLRLLSPGPYDWSSEEGRAETKGRTPPGRTSR